MAACSCGEYSPSYEEYRRLLIDVRNRPPTPEFEAYFSPDVLKFVSRRLGVPYAAHFSSHSLDAWYNELVECGVDHAVAVGRSTRFCEIPNEHVAELQGRYRGRVLGVAGIDVTGGIHDPIRELHRCVDELGLRIVAIDPGTALGVPPRHAGVRISDASIFPFYAEVEKLKLPLILMTGPFAGPDISYTHPSDVDRVASAFPNLVLVLGHGCYPYVTETIGVAYKHRSVYVAPDCYMFAPGAHPYVEAANGMLQRQILFGSAYPFSSALPDVLARTREFGLSDAALAAYLGGNSERVFSAALESI